MSKVKKVLVFGTFDVFHEGHKNFFEQARKYGDYLVAVVARDATVEKIKKRSAKNDEKKRLEKIKSSKLPDEVLLGNIKNKYAVIKKIRPDVICLGYDQNFFIDKLEEKMKEFGLDNTKIIRLKSHKPEIYKSSKFRKLK